MKCKGSTSTFHYVMRIGLLFNEEYAYIRTLSQSTGCFTSKCKIYKSWSMRICVMTRKKLCQWWLQENKFSFYQQQLAYFESHFEFAEILKMKNYFIVTDKSTLKLHFCGILARNQHFLIVFCWLGQSKVAY